MNPYYLIFLNSMQSVFIVSLHGEVAWFAARDFASYNMFFATLAALGGVGAGMGINVFLGYAASRSFERWFKFGDVAYARIGRYARKYGVWVLAISLFPFMGLYAAALAMFRVPPWMILGLFLLGRVVYYGWYLAH